MLRGKIVVVGAGFVGSTTAYTIMLDGFFREIVLIDVNKDKADGDALDMAHGTSFLKPVSVYSGDWKDCAGADIVVITAGVNQKVGETRIDLLKRNTEIFKSIVEKINEDKINKIMNRRQEEYELCRKRNVQKAKQSPPPDIEDVISIINNVIFEMMGG